MLKKRTFFSSLKFKNAVKDRNRQAFQQDHLSPQNSPRVNQAIETRANSVNDFFGGWAPEDILLFQEFRTNLHNPKPGQIVDWLGVRTNAANHPWVNASTDGIKIDDLPIPDDGLHAEAIEYFALLSAIKRTEAQGKQLFSMAELGSSYGPWISAGGITALRRGFKKVSLLAVEASQSGINLCIEHMDANSLSSNKKVDLRVIHGAVGLDETPAYFPVINTTIDNGAQVIDQPTKKDYRGLDLDFEKIDSYSLAKLLDSTESLNFLHMDLQGFEEKLLGDQAFLGTLKDKVEHLFLATQSRFIEGLAIKTLPGLGFDLIRERPTTFSFNRNRPDSNGWTTRDGGQFWVKTV